MLTDLQRQQLQDFLESPAGQQAPPPLPCEKEIDAEVEAGEHQQVIASIIHNYRQNAVSYHNDAEVEEEHKVAEESQADEADERCVEEEEDDMEGEDYV